MTTRHTTTDRAAGYRTPLVLTLVSIAALVFAGGYISGLANASSDVRDDVSVETYNDGFIDGWGDGYQQAMDGDTATLCADYPELVAEYGVDCRREARR